MRLCRVLQNGTPRNGRVEGDEIILLTGTFGHWQDTNESLPIAQATWLPPVIPQNFFCAGLNYAAHAAHYKKEVPPKPDIGYRANNALNGHNAPIIRPADFIGSLEYEGELVAVIGRDLRHASRAEAEDAIFGWTIGNDVSAREWQRTDRTFWRAKNSDSFKPMGPWMETEFSPKGARTEIFVNGHLSSAYDTGAMVYDTVDFIVEITRYCTIAQGDVIWLGTDTSEPMHIGDLVEISISGIGTLANKVISESN